MADDALPLFPLHTVLFPGAELPLHVFEPRYRLLVARCLERQTPFGVVLIRAGREVGEAAEPYDVGTTAEIADVQRLDDGRFYLRCVGRDRFRIRDLLSDQPYLGAHLEPIGDAPAGAAAEPAAALAHALADFAAAAEVALPDLPAEPLALSFAAAALLPLPLNQAQRLLETTSTTERLGWLLELVQRERALAARVGHTRPAHPGETIRSN